MHYFLVLQLFEVSHSEEVDVVEDREEEDSVGSRGAVVVGHMAGSVVVGDTALVVEQQQLEGQLLMAYFHLMALVDVVVVVVAKKDSETVQLQHGRDAEGTEDSNRDAAAAMNQTGAADAAAVEGEHHHHQDSGRDKNSEELVQPASRGCHHCRA
jgi:hypothetical protein